MKPLAGLATLVAFILAGTTLAVAGGSVPTEVVIKGAEITPSGALETSGRVRSERRVCRQGRFVLLTRRDTEGKQVIDGDLTSFAGSAWALRARPEEVTQGSEFFVKAPRSTTFVFDPNARDLFREIRCAKGEPVPVPLP